MNIIERIEAFDELSRKLNNLLIRQADPMDQLDFDEILQKAEHYNPWFTQSNLKLAINNLTDILDKKSLETWIENYAEAQLEDSELRVGVIMAGNIPLVGFHDFLSVMISGKSIVAKLSSSDQFLLPYLTQLLIEINPAFKSKITFESHLLKNFDAIIATGSNNARRYFDYYFSKYPHIIRGNRNSLAILSGNESADDLHLLGMDIFQYFGLGCRSVSKILIPAHFKIESILSAFDQYAQAMQHNKYFNNYEYNKAILLINKVPHYDNGFLLMKEDQSLLSPVALLHYEIYKDLAAEIRRLNMQNEDIQCIVGSNLNIKNLVKFGETQSPGLMDYADNKDIIQFLIGLKKGQ